MDAAGYGDAVWAADFAAYPEAVLALMGPMEEIPLTDEDLNCLAGNGGSVSPETRAQLAAALPRFAEAGAHMRLGLCSFKSGPAPLLPIFTADQAVTTMRMHNQRVSGIAAQMLTEGRDAALYLRPYREVPRWCEFRAFIRARKLVGISQYHLDHNYPQILEHSEQIGAALRSLTRQLLPALHVEDIVADIMLDPVQVHTALLIELNPFLQRTGACLFSWAGGGDFDGTFRIM